MPFVLIHSPLVGPLTWQNVTLALAARGKAAIVPTLTNNAQPFWEHHARCIARAIREAQFDEKPILIAHSGAGVLLPAIRQTLGAPVSGYIFVDAIIPEHHKSRMDLFDTEEERQQMRSAACDGVLPPWPAAFTKRLISDSATAEAFAAELRPVPLALYEEAVPVFANWPDAPCAYLQFTPTYDTMASRAKTAGWHFKKSPGGHFKMLDEPGTIASALLQFSNTMKNGTST